MCHLKVHSGGECGAVPSLSLHTLSPSRVTACGAGEVDTPGFGPLHPLCGLGQVTHPPHPEPRSPFL